jgi:hypothetical protein
VTAPTTVATPQDIDALKAGAPLIASKNTQSLTWINPPTGLPIDIIL